MTTTGIERIARRASRQPATIYVVNAPLHSGQPADVLHGAGGNESAWSGWSNKSNLWAELGGKPAGTAPETASDVVSTATSATCRDTKEDGLIAHRRQDRSGDDATDLGSHLRTGVYQDLLWLPSGKSCHDALRQLNQEVMSQPVNWIVDLDLAQFSTRCPIWRFYYSCSRSRTGNFCNW